MPARDDVHGRVQAPGREDDHRPEALRRRGRPPPRRRREPPPRPGRRPFEEQGDDAFPGHGNPPPADDELRRLRAEVARLKAERDLLKKAAAYFASPPS